MSFGFIKFRHNFSEIAPDSLAYIFESVIWFPEDFRGGRRHLEGSNPTILMNRGTG
jgi:hypothetical protein